MILMSFYKITNANKNYDYQSINEFSIPFRKKSKFKKLKKVAKRAGGIGISLSPLAFPLYNIYRDHKKYKRARGILNNNTFDDTIDDYKKAGNEVTSDFYKTTSNAIHGLIKKGYY